MAAASYVCVPARIKECSERAEAWVGPTGTTLTFVTLADIVIGGLGISLMIYLRGMQPSTYVVIPTSPASFSTFPPPRPFYIIRRFILPVLAALVVAGGVLSCIVGGLLDNLRDRGAALLAAAVSRPLNTVALAALQQDYLRADRAYRILFYSTVAVVFFVIIAMGVLLAVAWRAARVRLHALERASFFSKLSSSATAGASASTLRSASILPPSPARPSYIPFPSAPPSPINQTGYFPTSSPARPTYFPFPSAVPLSPTTPTGYFEASSPARPSYIPFPTSPVTPTGYFPTSPAATATFYYPAPLAPLPQALTSVSTRSTSLSSSAFSPTSTTAPLPPTPNAPPPPSKPTVHIPRPSTVADASPISPLFASPASASALVPPASARAAAAAAASLRATQRGLLWILGAFAVVLAAGGIGVGLAVGGKRTPAVAVGGFFVEYGSALVAGFILNSIMLVRLARRLAHRIKQDGWSAGYERY
ncbi:hypothetical protein DFJ73DRAFT_774024 [Zopfochytrium polystomum]|nr:hypothetical protein DFJ73DRAFT_774024 [Zopfochytrium polystomum]